VRRRSDALTASWCVSWRGIAKATDAAVLSGARRMGVAAPERSGAGDASLRPVVESASA
jgi:hypothetical protein